MDFTRVLFVSMQDGFTRAKLRFLRNGPKSRLASKTLLDLAQILAHGPAGPNSISELRLRRGAQWVPPPN
jgi:hypothetical protein